jgi:hypothetical protein
MDHGNDVQGAGKDEIVHRLLLRTWKNFFPNRAHGRETAVRGAADDADELQPGSPDAVSRKPRIWPALGFAVVCVVWPAPSTVGPELRADALPSTVRVAWLAAPCVDVHQ